MGHKERLWFPKSTHHITIRGNRRNDIFRDEEDFQVYLTLIQGAIEHFNNEYEIVCYCLMDNHVHLLLHTKEKHMKYFMGRTNSIYTRYFNNKYNYCGHLYEKRYFSELIEGDSQMLETSRYIHLNPVKANMVEKPEDYKWSSYVMFIGDAKEKLVKTNKLLNYFHLPDKRKAYKNFVEEQLIYYKEIKNRKNKKNQEVG